MMKSRLLFLLAAVFTISLTGCRSTSASSPDQLEVETTKVEKNEPAKPAAPVNEYKTSWEEDCSVEQAFDAANQALSDLDLALDFTQTRTVRTRDPKTGRLITRQVPTNNTGSNTGSKDGLSAYIQTKTALSISLRIEMYLDSSDPASTQITLKASSGTQDKDILQQQCKILKQNISQAIQSPEQIAEEPEPTPYPDTFTFDRLVHQVYQAIYEWAKREHFEVDSSGRDRFYKVVTCKTGSGISFRFTMSLVEENQTQLKLEISNYEEKGEFETILASLLDALAPMKQTEEPQAPNEEIILLNQSVSAVYDALINWSNENRFGKSKNLGGDQFYKYCDFYTANNIGFSFKMYLITPEQTKLVMNYSGHEDKEEFPMIMKNLKETLEKLNQ